MLLGCPGLAGIGTGSMVSRAPIPAKPASLSAQARQGAGFLRKMRPGVNTPHQILKRLLGAQGKWKPRHKGWSHFPGSPSKSTAQKAWLHPPPLHPGTSPGLPALRQPHRPPTILSWPSSAHPDFAVTWGDGRPSVRMCNTALSFFLLSSRNFQPVSGHAKPEEN